MPKSKKVKGKKYKKTKKYSRPGGGKITKEQIKKDFLKDATPMTDDELRRLYEYNKITREREIQKIQNAELEMKRNNIIRSLASTPMDPEEIKRQNRDDELHNELINSEESKRRKLTVADLGGSKKKRKGTKKGKKSKKHKKTRGGNRIGGNNCNDPNFSIYNTNLLKLFPYKGGELQLDDPYKNSEGSQF